MSIFSPKSKNATPLSGSVMPNYTPISGMRGFAGSILPNYTPIARYQQGQMGEYFTNGAVQGLGSSAAPGEIPWQCWGAPGFQDCHASQWAAAHDDCVKNAAQYGMSVDDCTAAFSSANDGSVCVPKYCGQYAAVATTTAALGAATVKKAQQQLNADLSRNGYKTIAADGKLGPATCGAASYLYNTTPRQSTVWTDYDLYAYCGSSAGTNPTVVGASKPITTYVAPQVNVVQGQATTTAAITHQWGVQDAEMADLQNNINRILDSYGYLAIPITQKLDAATCGAMKWIGDNTGNNLLSMNGGQNCQAYTLPTKKPASQSPSTAPKGSAPPGVAPPAPTPPGTHPLTSASMLVGGLALAVAGVGYYYAKKKGMV